MIRKSTIVSGASGAKRMSRLLPALIAWSAIYFAWRAFYWHESVSLSIIAHDIAVGRPTSIYIFYFSLLGSTLSRTHYSPRPSLCLAMLKYEI